MTLPTSIADLTVREAVKDALYRCVHGLDSANKELFDSAWKQDAAFELFGKETKGLDAIHTDMYNHISKLDTTHFITNERVQVDKSGKKATLQTHALAQHFRPSEGLKPDSSRFLTGGYYDLQLVKDDTDDLWKVTVWKVQIVWTEGDITIVQPSS